jgi:hypothetical protein
MRHLSANIAVHTKERSYINYNNENRYYTLKNLQNTKHTHLPHVKQTIIGKWTEYEVSALKEWQARLNTVHLITSFEDITVYQHSHNTVNILDRWTISNIPYRNKIKKHLFLVLTLKQQNSSSTFNLVKLSKMCAIHSLVSEHPINRKIPLRCKSSLNMTPCLNNNLDNSKKTKRNEKGLFEENSQRLRESAWVKKSWKL